MGTRPKEIFHLFGDLNNLSGIGPKTIINLKNLSIEKPRDFLFNLPFSVLDRLPVKSVREVSSSQIVTVEVLVKAHKVSRSRASASPSARCGHPPRRCRCRTLRLQACA